jgi:nitroreductase
MSDDTTEMGLFEAMYNCRAMRKLANTEVPEADLLELIGAANQAPSGSNTQGARWIIVRDPETKTELAALNKIGVESYLAPLVESPGSLSHQPADKRQRMVDAVVWQKEHMHEIPALIIACMDFGATPTSAMIAGGNGSIWPGIQNLLLAARAMQLGAAPTTLALTNPEAVAKVLNLPNSMHAYCLIPVGYPLGRFGPVTRKPIAEILRFNRWSD